MNNFFYHNPVLLEKSICELVTDPNGIYVDATYGGGGHSKEVLCRLTKKGSYSHLIKILILKENLTDDKRFYLSILISNT